MCAKWPHSCSTLCKPMDYSSPGSSVHGIIQAKILKWVAIFSSRGIFPTQGVNPWLLCLLHWQAGSLPLVPPGKPRSLIAGFELPQGQNQPQGLSERVPRLKLHLELELPAFVAEFGIAWFDQTQATGAVSWACILILLLTLPKACMHPKSSILYLTFSDPATRGFC